MGAGDNVVGLEPGVTVYLETERLALRRLNEGDVDNLYELDSDPEVMRWLSGGTPTPRDAIQNEILPRFLEQYEQYPGFGHWAAIEKAGGEFVGWFGLMPRRDQRDVAELGYRLRRTAWGNGYATEGARTLLRRGFTTLGLQRVVATTYSENLASQRVMQKIGMRLVRTFRYTPEQLRAGDTYHVESEEIWPGEDVEYALDRAEWEQMEVSGPASEESSGMAIAGRDGEHGQYVIGRASDGITEREGTRRPPR